MSKAPSPRSRLLIMWMIIVITGLFTISYSMDYGLLLPSSIYINLIAIIFLIIGIFIRIVALIEIRNAFKIDKLVTSGIYSKTRNPTYLGFTFIIIGISIVSLAILSFIWVIISIVLFYYVAKKEEKDLEKIFGENYLEYKNSVPLFIPKLKK
ncbi:methyltransferase family protein [Methanobacterium oryzae]|uniref:methyltransferase family protein n=1 Tax=Methanobacterium oryzae TaxID=69540 RepID=UPI003D1A71B2